MTIRAITWRWPWLQVQNWEDERALWCNCIIRIGVLVGNTLTHQYEWKIAVIGIRVLGEYETCNSNPVDLISTTQGVLLGRTFTPAKCWGRETSGSIRSHAEGWGSIFQGAGQCEEPWWAFWLTPMRHRTERTVLQMLSNKWTIWRLIEMA